MSVERPCDCFKHSRRNGKYLLCDKCGSVREIGVEQPKPTAPADKGEEREPQCHTAALGRCPFIGRVFLPRDEYEAMQAELATFKTTVAEQRNKMYDAGIEYETEIKDLQAALAEKEKERHKLQEELRLITGVGDAHYSSFKKEIAEKEKRIEELEGRLNCTAAPDCKCPNCMFETGRNIGEIDHQRIAGQLYKDLKTKLKSAEAVVEAAWGPGKDDHETQIEWLRGWASGLSPIDEVGAVSVDDHFMAEYLYRVAVALSAHDKEMQCRPPTE